MTRFRALNLGEYSYGRLVATSRRCPLSKVARMTHRPISTEELAAACAVKPQSIRVRLCRTGHYFGLRPDKLPNGRLLWPADWREQMVAPARQGK